MPDVDGGKTARIILYDTEDIPEARAARAVLDLCHYLGMTAIGGPVTHRIEPGFSCVLVIAESHIAIHTWPETSSVRVVIDCCVDFDQDSAAVWLQDAFGAERYTYSLC
jgi:S-adenosylmethionine/arginine decarboxylase-like enzyme